jgi:hypothetical protein
MANKPEVITVPTPSSGERFSRRELTPGRPLWFRQNGESAIAYADFIHFLMLPKEDRTYRKTAEAAGKSPSLIEKRGQQWSWQLRAASYEEHYMLLKLESVEAERDRMFVEHRALTASALQLVDAHMKALINRLGEEEGLDALLEAGYKPADIVRLFKEIEAADRQLVLERTKNAKDAQDREEKLAEKHSDELAALCRTMLDEMDLSPQQRKIAEQVVRKELIGVQGDEVAV